MSEIRTRRKFNSRQTDPIVNHTNDQATARTLSYVISVPELRLSNFEPIATRTRVMEEVGRIIPNEVLDIDLVVDGLLGHGGRPAEYPSDRIALNTIIVMITSEAWGVEG